MNNEIINNYVYEYGLDQTIKLLNLSETCVSAFLMEKGVKVPTYKERQLRKVRYEKNLIVESLINKRYNDLYNEFVKDKDISKIGQSDEDIFHMALTHALEEEWIKEYSDLQLYIKSTLVRHKMDYKSFQKHVKNNYEITDYTNYADTTEDY